MNGITASSEPHFINPKWSVVLLPDSGEPTSMEKVSLA